MSNLRQSVVLFILVLLNYFQILQNGVLYTSGEDIVLATYRNSFMITMDIPASRRRRSTDNAVLSNGYDISLSYDGQNFGEEIRIIIYDDFQYSCNATTQTCITLVRFELLFASFIIYTFLPKEFN